MIVDARGPSDRLQRPIRDLRISLTDRCTFRCPYCMPAEVFHSSYKFQSRDELLSFEEIIRLVELFSKLGVTKLRLTGGEPLLRRGLPDLISALSSIGPIDDIAMTTNASLLSDQVHALRSSGLNRLTISLDALDEDVFRKMSGGHFSAAKVLQGMDSARSAGFGPLKINCVVRRGVNEQEIPALARMARETGDTVRFIEFMDVGTLNGWKLDEVVSAKEMIAIIETALGIKLIPLEPNRDGEVARRFGFEDGIGEIGLITSITQPFCGSCHRARLSTRGQVYTCLFASEGHDLREPMRRGESDEGLLERMIALWSNRKDRYSEVRHEATALGETTEKRRIEMFEIGG